MDQIQQGIILLLKGAITQEPQALPDGFDMEAAYPLIRKHHMATLCYDGALRCGISHQHPVMRQLFQAYCKAMAISEGQMRELARVFAAFDENGIDYMPLKGSNMKALYPKPELRIMGDADVLIRVEQYDRIVPIMESLGFTASLESDHELTWKSPALYLELHKRLIATRNKDFYAYYGDGWKLAAQRKGTRYSMTAEDAFIYLFTHFSKHYRTGGIGCRHVLDLWVFLRSHCNLDETYIEAELEKLCLLEFYQNIRELLASWFENVPMCEKLDMITGYIFASGSWGHVEEKLLHIAIRESKCYMLIKNNKIMYIWRNLFPSAEQLQNRYPVLRRSPWLLPGVWVIRLISSFVTGRLHLRNHRRNLRLLNKENLDAQQRMLNYVGLDYNF